MKLLMPFWTLELFDRYFPEMKAIAKRIDEFNVSYVAGKPKKEWNNLLDFHKVRLGHDWVKKMAVRWWLSKGEMFRQIRDIDVDLYYCLSDFWLQELARYCALKQNKPYVIRLRGDNIARREFMDIPWLKKRFYNHYEKRSIAHANLIIPIRKEFGERVKKWGVDERKITKPVSLGVNADFFKPIPNAGRYFKGFTVGYAGRVSGEKRVSILVKAAKQLPDVKFVIAGWWQLNEKWDFPSNVEYLGVLRFEEMPTFYNRIDLLALPSVEEGFGSVILEAYACEKPVLVAKGALPEELKVFGSEVVIEEFESEIKRLIKLDFKDTAENARRYVKRHYTWENFAQSIVHHLRSLLI